MPKEIKTTDSTVSIDLPDSLTIYDISNLHESLLSHSLKESLVLNMAKTNEIDSTGIQLLLALQKNCTSHSNGFTLTNVNDEVAQILSLFQCNFTMSIPADMDTSS